LEHPIWLVETNAPPIDDPAWPVPDWFLSVNLDEQAAFVPQAMSSALAAGDAGLYRVRTARFSVWERKRLSAAALAALFG
jgi:hypothetical protein